MKNLLVRLGPKAPRYYVQIMAFILIVTYMITPALAVEDMWTCLLYTSPSPRDTR